VSDPKPGLSPLVNRGRRQGAIPKGGLGGALPGGQCSYPKTSGPRFGTEAGPSGGTLQ